MTLSFHKGTSEPTHVKKWQKAHISLKLHLIQKKSHFRFFNFRSWRKESAVIFLIWGKSKGIWLFWSFTNFSLSEKNQKGQKKTDGLKKHQISKIKIFLYRYDHLSQENKWYKFQIYIFCFKHHLNYHSYESMIKYRVFRITQLLHPIIA